MGRYVIRRLVQAVVTVFGVMLLTFVLFRVIAGDVSSSYVNMKLGAEAKRAFNEKHKLDRPEVLNFHRRLMFTDRSQGNFMFAVADSGASKAARALELHLAPYQPAAKHAAEGLTMVGKLIFHLTPGTPLATMTGGKPLLDPAKVAAAHPFLVIALSDGARLTIDLTRVKTCGDLVAAVNGDPSNGGRLIAGVTRWTLASLFDSQFFWHLYENVTFSGRSYATEQSILQTIGERGKFSLSITVPAMALGLFLAMVFACLVAYYRGGFIDKFTVFVTVLGMCIPYLAYMLLGQWIMFHIAPKFAAGLASPAAIYVPVAIAVIAGLGASVRFYRVVILNEVSRDYVRTARAKGVPLPGILFRHVLKNCMLPILTEVISEIPFLIMGALLLEKFFGVPGLGDLFLTSITSRDVPVITGLTYFTTILYVVSLLLTDILYAVFDPRIRLR